MTDRPFWKRKQLDEMTHAEWESLCDGCGQCCLIKFEDIDTGELLYSNIVCRHFDNDTARCQCYSDRTERVPDCWVLTPQNVHEITWLPETCAYRLVRDGRDLPDWHPLVAGESRSIREAGISICDNCISEAHVHVDDWQRFFDDMVIETVDEDDEETDPGDHPSRNAGT